MKNFMNIYGAVVGITTLLAVLFRNDKKKFIISTAIVHIFVCGCRYDLMHGDLSAYKRGFYSAADAAWNSNTIISNGRNTLFYALNKLVANLSNNNFQVLLFVISFISIASISYIIYKYSEMPYISFLMWNCFGFYLFSFYSIKQALAMAFIMLSVIGIFEHKRILFYILVAIAGFIHFPSLVFLPAYELCRAQKMGTIIRFYLIFAGCVILFHNNIVSSMSQLYYEGGKFSSVQSFGIGGKTLMMMALLAVGILLCNLRYEKYRYTFILIATASLLQMFSVYDNIFTRLADYYFQFIILYAPFILSQPFNEADEVAFMNFNEESRKLLVIAFAVLALLFYYKVNLSYTSSYAGDDLIANFKFFWE